MTSSGVVAVGQLAPHSHGSGAFGRPKRVQKPTQLARAPAAGPAGHDAAASHDARCASHKTHV